MILPHAALGRADFLPTSRCEPHATLLVSGLVIEPLRAPEITRSFSSQTRTCSSLFCAFRLIDLIHFIGNLSLYNVPSHFCSEIPLYM